MSLLTKPWLHKGLPEGGARPAFDVANEKVALVLFVTVVAVVFSLLAVAYFIRMTLADWTALALPSLVWLNTAVLVLASVLMQSAKNLYKQNPEPLPAAVRQRFLLGGVVTLAFIAGQYVAWEQLMGEGRYLVGDPAAAFFYLLTGLHALHLLGGLWVWSQSCLRMQHAETTREMRLSIELCTTYWHFLLLVWLGLLYLLATT